MRAEPPVRLTELSNLLWRQRRLLDLLHFKLEEEKLLLIAGHSCWVAPAAREIELVLDELARMEMARAVEVAEVGHGLGLGPQPTLDTLAQAAPVPWGSLLGAHRQALRHAAHRVQELAEENRALLRDGAESTHRLLEALTEDPIR